MQQHIVLASSLSSPPARHSHGNGNRANNTAQAVPVSRHRSCIGKMLYLTEPTAKHVLGSAEDVAVKGSHRKPAHTAPLLAGIVPSAPALCWGPHCGVFRMTRCHLVVT